MMRETTATRIGITGHRKLGAAEGWMADTLRRLLSEFHAETECVAVSALAVGADTLFADAAVDLGIPLEAVLPYAGYIEDFPAGAVRERYARLLASAAAIHRTEHTVKSSAAYMSTGEWIVDHCDRLVAVYDGRQPEHTGGTADVVDYARGKVTRIVIADPVARLVTPSKLGG
jgi:hypothetical protein